jgi:hypothetical protein
VKQHKTYYVFGALIVAVAAFAAWRILARSTTIQRHALLYDQSRSKIDGCECLGNEAARLFHSAKTRGEIVDLYTLGTADNGYQAKFVASFPIPEHASLLGDRLQTAKVIDEWTKSIVSECRKIPRTNKTPLVVAVKIVLEQLRSKCSPQSFCSLFIQSDLEDDVSPEFAKAVKAEETGRTIPTPTFDNTGIKVTFSGTSEIVTTLNKGQRSNKRRVFELLNGAEARKNVWLRMFTSPHLITFQPVCERSSAITSTIEDAK